MLLPFAFAMSVLPLGGNPAFTNQTAAAGLVATHQPLYFHSFLAGGTVGDFNGDGWQDVYLPTGGGAPDRLFINNMDGTFTDRAADWGIAILHRSTAGAVGDFDGDGWLDLYVTSLGPVSADQVGHHKLFRNVSGQAFEEVGVQAGVNLASSSTPDGWGAAWGDMDLDGDLDLAVAGWSSNDGNRLFENQGDGTFVDVTVSAGLAALTGINGFAPRFADMDGDRYPELIWIGDFGTSRYFINDQDGTFTHFTAGSGTGLAGTEMGMTIADWDEDGDFDLYVTTISSNKLYRNNGGHTYTDIAPATGTVNTGWGWGATAVDYDHDSLIDLVVTSQSNQAFAFRNMLSGPTLSFTEEGNGIGLNSSANGRGIASFDYDNDGDQDIVIFPRSGPVELHRNDLAGSDIHWLRIALDSGCMSDVAPNGVGSVVKATIGARTLTTRVDAGSNYMSQSEMTAHFGLGANTVVDELRIEWTNGDVTVMNDVPADQTLVVSANAYNFCASLPNSSGAAARIGCEGGAVISQGGFQLRADSLPSGQPGLFYFGPDELAGLAFGNGLRCVGGPAGSVHRLFPFAVSDPAGVLTSDLDFQGSAQPITAGSTWKFQAWFRDPAAGGAGFDLSDGLSATFYP